MLQNGTSTKDLNYFHGRVQAGEYSGRGYMAVLGALELDTFKDTLKYKRSYSCRAYFI